MIEIEHVSKNFGEKVVLRDVSATIQDGEIFAIIGPSGSGKSTLLRMINLLEIPDGGRIIVDGTDIHADRWRTLEIRRMMAMVFQQARRLNESDYERIVIGLG